MLVVLKAVPISVCPTIKRYLVWNQSCISISVDVARLCSDWSDKQCTAFSLSRSFSATRCTPDVFYVQISLNVWHGQVVWSRCCYSAPTTLFHKCLACLQISAACISAAYLIYLQHQAGGLSQWSPNQILNGDDRIL